MTDQTVPNVTYEDRRLARDWAEHIFNTPDASLPMETAAAHTLLALLPPLPTLAEMTLDEQDECVGMQADLAQGDRVVILDGTPEHDDRVQVLDSSLDVYRPVAALVTPRPDLPRMEWPGDKKPVDVPPVKVGDAIESAADPRLDALPAGSILLDLYGEKVEKISDETPRWTGPGCFPYAEEGTAYGPWMVLHIGEESG